MIATFRHGLMSCVPLGIEGVMPERGGGVKIAEWEKCGGGRNDCNFVLPGGGRHHVLLGAKLVVDLGGFAHVVVHLVVDGGELDVGG